MKKTFTTGLLRLVGLLLLAAGCSREQEQKVVPSQQYPLTLAATNARKANQANQLLAYLPLTAGITQYYYGDFDADGQPGTIQQAVVHDAASGLSLQVFFDDSLRVKTLYCSRNMVKDTLLFCFTYPTATTATLSLYRIDWATDLLKLRKRMVLMKTSTGYAPGGEVVYSTSLGGPAASQDALAGGGALRPAGLVPRLGAGPVAGSPTLLLNGSPGGRTLLGRVRGQARPALASRTTDWLNDFIVKTAAAAASIAISNAIIVVSGMVIGGLRGGVPGAVVGGLIGAAIALRSATAAELTATPAPFTTPPGGAPASPGTQTAGTQLQRYKLYAGFGSRDASVSIPTLGACCAFTLTQRDVLVGFGFSATALVGSAQYRVYRDDCTGTGAHVTTARFPATSLTAAGNAVVLNLGNATFRGTLTPRGGQGTLTVNTFAFCSTTAGVTYPFVFSTPIVLTALN